MYSEITRTCSGARPKRRGELATRVEDPLRRDPRGERVARPSARPRRAARAASARARASRRSPRHAASAPASAASGSPRTVSRGSSVNRCSVSPASRSSGGSASNEGASAASPAAAASGVSAATAATGAPAHEGSAVSGLLAAHRHRPIGAEHGPHARVALAASTSSPGHATRARPARAGRARAASRQLDVDRVAGAPARAHRAVLPRGGRADDGEPGVVGPRLDLVVLVDEHPDVLEAPLHLPLGLDQPRLHATACPDARRIARSIFGYAPQRQMFPAIAARISSRLGRATEASSAVAETTCPGVQKPHCSASSATNDSWSAARVAGEALDRRHRTALGGGDRQQAGGDRAAVQEDGAGPAGPLAAAVLGPRQREVVAEDGEQPAGRRDVEDVRLAVDLDRDGHPASSTGAGTGSSTTLGSCRGQPSSSPSRSFRPAAAARRPPRTTRRDGAGGGRLRRRRRAAAAGGRRRDSADRAPRPGADVDPGLRHLVREVRRDARPRVRPGDGRLARLPRAGRLLRRHPLPSHRPGLPDPGRRPDADRRRRARLPDGRRAQCRHALREGRRRDGEDGRRAGRRGGEPVLRRHRRRHRAAAGLRGRGEGDRRAWTSSSGSASSGTRRPSSRSNLS